MRAVRTRRRTRAGAVVLLTIVAGFAAVAPADAHAAPRLSKLSAVSCPTTAACLAVGADGVGRGVVVATSDAGSTWTVMTSPPSVETLTSATCWTARRCLVGGSGFGDAGAIYRTLDGGASWKVTPAALLGGFFLSLDCSPAAELCVAGGNEGAIRTSVDAGRTWDAQTLATISMINAVDCLSASACEAVGYFGGSDFGGVALRTSDGGATWPATHLPQVMAFPTGVSCPVIDTCVAVAQDTVNAGSHQLGRTARTTDGSLWRRHDVPPGYYVLSGVSCPTVNVCAAAGAGVSGMLRSVDGGRTWAPQGPSTAFERGISCSSVSVCVAVGETRLGAASIHRTVDGGQTWVRQPIG